MQMCRLHFYQSMPFKHNRTVAWFITILNSGLFIKRDYYSIPPVLKGRYTVILMYDEVVCRIHIRRGTIDSLVPESVSTLFGRVGGTAK